MPRTYIKLMKIVALGLQTRQLLRTHGELFRRSPVGFKGLSAGGAFCSHLSREMRLVCSTALSPLPVSLYSPSSSLPPSQFSPPHHTVLSSPFGVVHLYGNNRSALPQAVFKACFHHPFFFFFFLLLCIFIYLSRTSTPIRGVF